MKAIALLLFLAAGFAYGQSTEVVTVPAQRGTIAGLVVHQEGAQSFKHGIALFPGHPGIMKIRLEGGEPQFEMRGNFLVRSRRHWVDDETLVVVVDAPSEEWTSFSQHFRSTPPYGADVKALIEALARRYRIEDWTFVGTSEGSVSAFHAARMNPALARRVILTSSVFKPGKNGPGLAGADWKSLKAKLLFVHHADDPCEYTSYRDAQRAAEAAAAPLLTVRGGGPAKGHPCQAFSAHGYVGVEREAVQAMHAWVRTGQLRSEPASPAR
jgi:pimeloyl-ACP methyl ester carboxylesterase